MKNTQHILTILLVFIGMLLSQNTSAQIFIDMDNAVVRKDERVCVDLVVEDFDQLIGVTFAVTWDPAVLEFEEVTNLAPIFSQGDFGMTKVSEGRLTFLWADPGIGQSLSDGQILFSVCLKAIGEEGDESKVVIGETEGDPGIEVLDKDGNNIGLSAPDAEISIDFEEAPENAIQLYYDDIEIQEGETFCVPIRVRKFTDISILSFSLSYNNNRFSLDKIQNVENWGGGATVFALPSNTGSTKGIVYSMTDNGISGQTLMDGEVLFEVCFKHELAETCVLEEIMISSTPTTIEAEIALADLNTEAVPVFYDPGKIKLRNPITYNNSEVTGVTCQDPNIGAISVDVSGGTDGVKYLWSTGATTNSISNLSVGFYDISISDICLAVDTIFRTFEISMEGDLPDADAGGDVNLICGLESVSLDGIGSSSGSSITYSWRGIDGQSILNGASDFVAEVDQDGGYELLVMDANTGCSSVDTVEVNDLRSLPTVMAGMDVLIECDDVTIALNGTGDSGVNYQYEWTTTNGNIVDQFSKGGINVDRAGTYIFRITESGTGCTATDTVVVSGGNSVPTVGISGGTFIDCNIEMLSLDASSVEESGVTYSWSTSSGSIVSGADAFQVLVNQPGTYEIIATNNTSGCNSSDQVLIRDMRTTPLAVAGDDYMIDCDDDDDITLIGSGTAGSGIEYSWETADGSIVSQTPDGQAIVNSAGTYTFTVLETSNGCSTSDDIIVTGDNARPQASIIGNTILDCNMDMLSLDASSAEESNVTYSWSTSSGSIVSGADAFQVLVNQAGTYEIIATNNISGCNSSDQVLISDMRTTPMAVAGDDDMIDCDDNDITLNGSGSTGSGFEYSWETSDGNIVLQTLDGQAIVNSAGTYTFTVLETANGCSSSDDVIVTGDNTRPQASIRGNTILDCDIEMLSLDGSIAEESGVTYSWSTSSGSIVSGAGAFQVIVNQPGTYEVIATNDISGCNSSDLVVIQDMRTAPMAVAGDDDVIDCDDDDITLNGSGSAGSGFEYSWETADGSIVSQTSDGQAIVNSAGTYTFTVLETANGCSTSDDVIVTGDNARPQASISGNTILDCNTTTLELNANNGSGAVTGLSYAWITTDGSIVDGSDQVLVSINQPGTYTVRVTNDASGCVDNSTVSITSEADEPTISAGADASIDCSTGTSTLTGTSDNMTNMNFQWNLIEGDGQIVSGSTNATAEVMGAGTYEVVVTNPLNGCMSRDTTVISLNSTLPAAQVGMDYDHCASETILMGNMEGDITGLWTVISGNAVLEDPMDRNCRVNSLSVGINTFVWTLSSSGCPEYSSDTIDINFIAEPVAVDDIFNVSQGFGSLDIDLLSNDQFSNETSVTLNLSSQPSIGVLTENGNGLFTYSLDNPNAFGTITFEYEICDDLCSLNCDSGMVTIDVRDGSSPPVDSTKTSNDPQSLGITPNGDGLNDQLIFDELITDNGKYSTKRLIVYNRWGDIVHEAQPYNNDWGGTNRAGALLPQGTYYFVMQLDLGQGAIIEGDITILQ